MNSEFSSLSQKRAKSNRFRWLASMVTFIITMLTLVVPLQAATLETKLFTKIPTPPGYPEGIVVSDDNTVYVGTHRDGTTDPTVPSRVYAYNKDGKLKKEYVIKGQTPNKQGILGMALDGKGDLYILDRDPARVIRLNPKTGQQTTYATFRDVQPCVNGQPQQNCSGESENREAFPDDLVFAPDGTLYVTDIQQALIWRIPPGGGKAEIWYTHPDLDSIFGPNGIRFADNGKTLIFAQTLHGITDPNEMFNGAGRLYKITIQPDGSPGKRTLLWEGKIGEAPDGFAISKSGNIYMALALPGALLVLSPDGKEILRTPATPEENEKLPIPYNTPANVAFFGKQVLVTNQAFLGGPPEHQVVFKVNVNEEGKKLFRPFIKAK